MDADIPKLPGGLVKSRLVASAAISALVLLGATGCTFITPQSTTIEYAASDGVNVNTGGPLEVRNALIVANEDGSTGNLVAAIVNPGAADATLTFEIDGLEPFTVRVGGNEVLSLGTNAEPIRIDDLDSIPGSTIEVYFQSGDETGEVIAVPVLDGTTPYYSDLVPAPLDDEEDEGDA